ncbi:unannotated protein [freshwater metagenome]|uniref:Unannotated protein n=1 Tax=freshwater metagenome TaxID=449393 RepID=A0A6J6V2M6_9ZZZZ
MLRTVAAGSVGMSTTSPPARRNPTAGRGTPRSAAISSASLTTSPSKPRDSRRSPLITERETVAGTSGSRSRTAMWPIITAGRSASTAARKGTRSVRSSCTTGRGCTGSPRWLSTVSDPWPGKCLTTGSTPASRSPRAAATPCRATVPGSEPAEREPITGSRGPAVTSVSGARSTSIPDQASSRPTAAWAARVSAGSPAAPAAMKAGREVTSPRIRSTRPPSWSTASSSGRPAARSSPRAAARRPAAEATFSSKTTSPPRWRSRTSRVGGTVPPVHRATTTCPARSVSDIERAWRAARSSWVREGPHPVARPSRSDAVGAGAPSPSPADGLAADSPRDGSSDPSSPVQPLSRRAPASRTGSSRPGLTRRRGAGPGGAPRSPHPRPAVPTPRW